MNYTKEQIWYEKFMAQKSKVFNETTKKLLLFFSSINRTDFSNIVASRKITTLLQCSIDGVDCNDDSSFEDVYHETYMKCIRFVPRRKNFRNLKMTLFADSLISHYPHRKLAENIKWRYVKIDGNTEGDSSAGLFVYLYSNKTRPHSPLLVGTGASTLIRVYQTDNLLYKYRRQSCKPTHFVRYKSFIGRCWHTVYSAVLC